MAGEQFGAMAVNLAGAEADTSAMQIEGLAKAGGQGLGQAVDGYNQADFNRAIQDGEAYLNQMADELDIPPEKRDMIKFFSGNPESVKAGAQFLMDSTEQQRRDTGINNMLGLGQGINEKYKTLSADILNKEGMTPEDMKAEQDKLISDKSGEIEGLRVASKDKYDLAGYDKVFGLGQGDDWKRYVDTEAIRQKDDRLKVSQESNKIKNKAETRKDQQFGQGLAAKASKDFGLSGSQGVRAMVSQSKSLVKAIKKAVIETKNGETPGFVPFGSLDALPDGGKKFLNEIGIGSKEYTQKANEFRASIGKYLDRYKKFISGTAVSDQEYNKLMFNLGAGTFSTFPQFLQSFKEMVAADAETYNMNYEDANKIYSREVGGIGALEERGVTNPGIAMMEMYGELDGIYNTVKDYKDAGFDGAKFKEQQALRAIDQKEKEEARAKQDAEYDKTIDRNSSNSFFSFTPKDDSNTQATIAGVPVSIGDAPPVTDEQLESEF